MVFSIVTSDKRSIELIRASINRYTNIILHQFQKDCLKFNKEYGIDTICVNHDERVAGVKRVQKRHPTMICQIACHVESSAELRSETWLTPDPKQQSTESISNEVKGK